MRKNREEDVMNILIVEDEASSRLLLKSFLSEYGDISLAEDGGQAIEIFRGAVDSGNYFDLVILDIKLPVMGGLDVLKTIRNIEAEFGIAPADGTKVIMSTALSDHKSVLVAFREQCEIYLVKPIEKAMLVESMRKLQLID
jgi:two-component system chemotaxis response regulator CheY